MGFDQGSGVAVTVSLLDLLQDLEDLDRWSKELVKVELGVGGTWMSVVVLSIVREVQRMQLKFSSWSLPRLRPLLFTCM